MAGKSIESLYSQLFAMRSTMEDLLTTAQSVVNTANQFGGEINRVVSEQMVKYFIPAVNDLIKNNETPGSVSGVLRFIDTCPLAFTRVEQNSDIQTPMIADINVIEPAGTTEEAMNVEPTEGIAPQPTEVEDIPQNASYQNPKGEKASQETAPQMESVKHASAIKEAKKKLTESEKFIVVRTMNQLSSFGDLSDNQNKTVVFEFDNEADAQAKADILNRTISADEADVFGTLYSVEKETFPKEPKAEESPKDKKEDTPKYL